MLWKTLATAVLFACTSHTVSAQDESPYAGQQTRQIKTFSTAEVQGYLEGRGMGFAKAAELNHYPGPKHVLELAELLPLTEEQVRQTESIFENMRAEAISLGERLLAAETELDARFASGTIGEDELDSLVAAIAAIRGQLRAAHLRAHLRQKRILTPEQVRRYDALRGYETH
ncbi:MAG: Spy/CpxP family protein refolding chaperone [Candidatus Krumholzibacteria bacterium]|nr:Spy/CpxP family protein refolding chaperone [Candidatus Krumholzibacteria bacterium]